MNQPRQLAALLYEDLDRRGVVDMGLLSRDPAAAIAADASVQLTWVAAASLPVGCGIAASYDPATDPATIAVADSQSQGRQAFSLLHEYGHHLRNQVTEVVLSLLRARTRRANLEERMCDAFASSVLMPESLLDDILRDGVTAAGVAELLTKTSASRQAALVAAAQRLGSPGYVAAMDLSGKIQFAARSGDVYPVRVGAQQDGALLRAARGVPIRATAALAYGTGAYTGELLIDTAPAGSTVIVVAVDGPVPWRAFSGARMARAEPVQVWCAECTATTSTFAAACEACDEHRCETCGRCACVAGTRVAETTCAQCFLTLPASSFGEDSDRCQECA